MKAYALFDHVVGDCWAIDGYAVVTGDIEKIAKFWQIFEAEEPGRYEIISADF